MWPAAVVKIFGMVFDLIVFAGTIWLILEYNWSMWWMLLAAMIVSGSWTLNKEKTKDDK